MFSSLVFEKELNALPPLIRPVVEKNIIRFSEACESVAEVGERINALTELRRQEIIRLFVGSDFCAEQLIRYPALFVELLDSGDCWRSYADDEYRIRLQQVAPDDLSESMFDQVLRCQRRREIIRIIWRDLCGFSTLFELTEDMSRLADAMIQHAIDYYYPRFCEKWGTPYSQEGEQQSIVVVGMGKLGALELNLSSDVDLLFCYPDSGATRGKKKALDNQTFFIRLGQRLIKSLSDMTAEGFVFRVDMRLRPYGQSGALAWSFDAMEAYYENQGREWERYALIKARIVGGDLQKGQALMDRLRPFVFRRYVDFGVIESLRDMKALINREVRRKGFEENVKTGSGGIREIEFIAQVFQLMRGGQEPILQDRRLKTILRHLDSMALLPAGAADQLLEAYIFLRNVEHRIQAMEDRQTQSLPMDALAQARLAYSMNYDEWTLFDVALQKHRAHVRTHFEAVIAPASLAEGEADEGPVDENHTEVWASLWLDDPETWEQNALHAALQGTGFETQAFEGQQSLCQLLQQLRQSRSVRQMQEVSRHRLDKLMPFLLQQLSQMDNAMQTIVRVLPLLEAIARRSAYIALLLENPGALKRLLQLCAASPWVTEQLTAHPILLDELLDSRSLYQPLKSEQLSNDLREFMLRVPGDDLEQQMEALRHFKRAQVLKVAAAEIVGHLPLMKVSDYLTWIAEALVAFVFQLAWQQMTEKYGCPMKNKETPCDSDFIIVAYGKMGGIELGYASDLDLVFLHDASTTLSTEGEKAIDNVVFFSRLGQRIIHLLSTNTPAGKLYDVDVRLRPSGASGLLVSSLHAFEKYQLSDAWTWEHQALARARVVAGCQRLTAKFESIRQQILCQQVRDEQQLKTDVLAMREKMRQHLATHDSDLFFSLKHDVGGVVDIEFIVQYCVLRWAYEQESLVTYTDNVRILEVLSRVGLLSETQADQLVQAYIAYRSAIHRLVLQNQKTLLAFGGAEADSFCQHRENVRHCWHQIFD
jgi:glutamate-ammonia-ligase adenylyltransferase